MPMRLFLALSGLLLISSPSKAQPWPPKDAQADATLESLLRAGVEGAALSPAPGPHAGVVRRAIVDAAKLAQVLGATRPTLTDVLCDAVALRWRDDAANRPFWTAYLRAIATATGRPRARGFADLFEGVAASGSATTAAFAEQRYTSARDQFQAAKDPAWVAASETEIGNLALALERFEDADAAYLRAGRLYAEARGPRDPLVASVVRNRGNVRYRQGKYAEAAQSYREALDLLGPDHGPNAAAIVDCLQNLAGAHVALLDAPAAKTALERGLAILRNAAGESPIRQLPFLEVLALVLQSRGETGPARDVARQALDIARDAFGAQSVEIVRYINALSTHERTLGQGKAARELDQDALRILERQPVPDPSARADVRAALGADAEALRQPAAAAAEYQQALEGYRKGTSRRDRIGAISVLERLAALAGEQGKIDESQSKYRDAINEATTTLGATDPFVGLLRARLGHQLLQDGAYPQGAAEFRAARALIDKTLSATRWAEATASLALALDLAGETTEAEREVNEAIAIFRREQHPDLAGAYTTLASIHRKRDEYEEAARVHRLALDIQRKSLGPENPLTLRMRSMVALDEQFAGKYADAEQSLQELAAIQLKLHDREHPEYLKVLTTIADVRAAAGEFSKAIDTYENVLKIQRDSKDFPPRARVDTLGDYARLLEKRRKPRQALEALKTAQTLLVDAGLADSLVHARVLEQLGGLAQTTGDAGSAERWFSEALAIHRRLRAVGPSDAPYLIKRLATLREEVGDVPGALKWVEEGLAALVADPAAAGIPWRVCPQSADLLTFQAELLLRSGPGTVATWKAAYRLLALAGAIADRLRFEERSSAAAKAGLIGPEQAAALRVRLTLCELLAQAEPAGGWTAEAFRTAEEGRARVFLEQLGRGRADRAGELPPDLAGREQTCARDRERLRRELETVEAAPLERREPVRIASVLEALGDATRTFEEIQALIARDHPRVAAFRRPCPCSVDEARRALARNEAAVIFCCGKTASHALVLQPAEAAGDGLELVPLPGTDEFEDDLEVLISENSLKVAELYHDKAVKVYRALISPLERHLGARDLVIVPDGMLGRLPFETLIDSQGRFLIESRALRMAPSMTALHLDRLWEQKRPRPTRTILAIGDPITSETDDRLTGQPIGPAAGRLQRRTGDRFDRLVHSGREATVVADVFHAPAEDRWLGWDASEGPLKSWSATGRLAEYRYLHFAAHGILGAGPELPPALVLSLTAAPRSAEDDGFLNLDEISRLRLNADLVVLAACHSARGELRAGEGVTGLARGFLSAGARGVLCSLWTADDRDTADLMAAIYQQLDRGVPAATALRTVKLRMIHDGKRPFDWANFIMIGGVN